MGALINKIDLSKKEQILSYLQTTSKDLTESLSSFSEEEFNISPEEGSWTAGQVAEHVLKSESGLSKVLTGKTGPSGRRSDEKNDMIQSIFLDFSTKMKSPDFIVPSGGPHKKELLIEKISTNRKNIIELAQTLDLSPLCYDFPLPGMDTLKRMEWLCFIVCHSTRHIRQIRNIKLAITH